MDWGLIGDLIILFSIFAGGITFIITNLNYLPNDENDHEGR